MKKLKIGKLYRATQKMAKTVPYIRLSGNYLKENGFKEGDIISIHIEKGLIILKKHSVEAS
jgi:hypothetical protein